MRYKGQIEEHATASQNEAQCGSTGPVCSLEIESMSTNTLEANEDDGSHPLDGETTAELLPDAWVDDRDEPLAAGETRYYAVMYTVERVLSGDADVLSGREPGRGEEYRIHVLYVRGDASRRVERSYPATVVDDGSGVRVRPKGGIQSSIAVDGSAVTPAAGKRAQLVVEALDELHDVTVPRTGGGT
jgi:hypothetical protein